MPIYEFKVVPAPDKGEKAKGAKGTRERFAATLEALMNTLGREGWDYVRADVLPCEERSGLTGSTTTYHNLLVFRRIVAGPDGAEAVTSGAQAATVAPVRLPNDHGAMPPLPAPSRGAPVPSGAVPALQAGTRGTETAQAAAAAAAAALTAYRSAAPQPQGVKSAPAMTATDPEPRDRNRDDA